MGRGHLFLTIILLGITGVAYAAPQQASPSKVVAQAIRHLLPDENITVDAVRGAMVLSGPASSATAAERAVKIARQFVKSDDQVLNFMQIRGGQQVMLRVRVGEIQRSALKGMGDNIYHRGSNGLINQLDGLAGTGVFKMLAEPTLVAISGEPAEFMAGGEFPVPVSQGQDKMSVEYKPFGVRISFTPYVLASNRIRLNVEPEISEIAGMTQFMGTAVPTVTSHYAKTTVELAPGESFMIAGIIKDNFRSHLGSVPGVGSMPIYGQLSQSRAFQNNESELVIAVTPYLVDPVVSRDIKMPTDNFNPHSEIDRLFRMRMQQQYPSAAPAKLGNLEGSSGFITE
jgi:pilus assembly protein CpaC